MKSRGIVSVETPKYVRFIERADVQRELTVIQDGVDSLNDQFDDPSLNASTVLGLDAEKEPHRPRSVMGAIAFAEGHSADPYRLAFHRHAVRGRKMGAAASVVSECFNTKAPIYEMSKMNPEENFVFAYPLLNEDVLVGAVRHEFYYPDHDLPDEAELHARKALGAKAITSIANSLHKLQKLEPRLLTNLELAPPVTSNHYAICWDIVNAKLLKEINYGAYIAYTQHFKQAVEEIVLARYPDAQVGAVDGQTIVIKFPGHIAREPHDTMAVKTYQSREIAGLAAVIEREHYKLAHAYKNAFSQAPPPRISVQYGNGFFEEDAHGMLQSPFLHSQKNNIIV